MRNNSMPKYGYIHVLVFLQGAGTDHRGRTLAAVLAQDDEWFEGTHDFVQWLFPSTQPSLYSHSAPVLTAQELRKLGADERTRDAVLQAYARMLRFLGLQCNEEGVCQRADASPIALRWMRRADHNDKRLTRMLICLAGMGLEPQARQLLAYLLERFPIGGAKGKAPEFWAQALEPAVTER